MAKIIKSRSGDSHSFRVTIPADMAKEFIKKYGNEVTLKKCGRGFKISPIKEVSNEN